jgi:large subunit ribosomal protein L19
MKSLLRVERDNMKKKIPVFSVGDTVRVHVKVIEGDKVRTQIFQGTVIGRRGGGVRETFIVRKISANIAVERIFPLHSPNVVKIERIRKGRVRRAQLTYMKERKGKRARIAGQRMEGQEATEVETTPTAEADAAPPPEETEAKGEDKAEGKPETKGKAAAKGKAKTKAKKAKAEEKTPEGAKAGSE